MCLQRARGGSARLVRGTGACASRATSSKTAIAVQSAAIAPRGFEPRFCGPKPHVLPLDDGADWTSGAMEINRWAESGQIKATPRESKGDYRGPGYWSQPPEKPARWSPSLMYGLCFISRQMRPVR